MENAALNNILALQASGFQLPETLMPVTVLPENTHMVNMEKYLNGRLRFRGSMNTSSKDSFAEYVNGRDESTCFINPDNMSAKAIFNIGTTDDPGHCDDTAELSLEQTGPYRALLAIAGSSLDQRQAAEFIEDWRSYISVTDEHGETMHEGKAAASIRSMTVEQVNRVSSDVGNFSESKSAMEKIEAKSSQKQPAFINFTCNPYDGLSERTFEVRIANVVRGGSVGITYRIMRHEAEIEEMAKEFKELLSSSLKDNISTYIGKFSA